MEKTVDFRVELDKFRYEANARAQSGSHIVPLLEHSSFLGVGDFLQGLRYGFKQLGVLERIGRLQLRLFSLTNI